MLRWHPRFTETDPSNPSTWATCSRCGFQFCLNRMVWQYDYRGTPSPINTQILVCGRPSCLDIPNPQLSPVVLSPDPPPIYNARPELYALDETNWLTTEGGEIIDTEDDNLLISTIPNPSGASPVVSDITTEDGDEIVTENDNNMITDYPNPDVVTLDPNPENTELPP